MQQPKTEYKIKIADLSDISTSKLKASVNKKLNKILKKGKSPSKNKLYLYIDMNINEALYKKFKSLKDLRAIFKTNEDCIEFLEELIWRGEPVSPYDITSQVYKCKDGWYKCKNTGKEFNILTKTLFQNTKIDLPTWFEIIFREHSDKGGLAATTIMRDYGLSYTTAWHGKYETNNKKELKKLLENALEVFFKLHNSCESNEDFKKEYAKYFGEEVKDFSKEISENRDDSLSDFAKIIQKVYYSKDKNPDC